MSWTAAFFGVLTLVVLGPTAVHAQAPRVTLEISDQGVRLDARNATVRDILNEWARVGGLTVVNGDQLASDRVTLQLNDVAESEAIRVVLRGIPGYLLTPQAADGAGRSRFGKLLLLTSRGRVEPSVATRPSRPVPVVEDEDIPVGREQESFAPSGARGGRVPGAPARGSRESSDQVVVDAGFPGAGTDPEANGGIANSQATSPNNPPFRRPMTPILPPIATADAAHPFGTVKGSATPGMVTPTGPPPGFEYPPITSPESPRPR